MDKRYTLSLACIFVCIFGLIGYYVDRLEGITQAQGAYIQALEDRNDYLESLLPDPHATAFGE